MDPEIKMLLELRDGMKPFLTSQIKVLTELLASLERGDLGPISYVARRDIRRVIGRQPIDIPHD